MTSLDYSVNENAGKGFWPLLIVSGLLAAVGVFAWVMQFINGIEVLEIGQIITWSLYIAAFFLLVGIGGGLLILGSLANFGIFPTLEKYSRKMAAGALACFIPAGIMILMDIGQPGRVLNLLFNPNFSSMFVWDFYFLVIAAVVALVLIFSKSKALSCAGGIVGAALIVVEGFILTAAGAGAPLWHSPLVPVSFLVEGVVAALAIVLIVYAKQATRALKGTLAALLSTLLLFCVIELISISYLGADAAEALKVLTTGSLAPFYWGQIVLGLIVPIVLLIWVKGSGAAISAAIFAFLGVAVLKFNLLIAGQAIDSVGVQACYTPTLIEIGGFVGALGLAAFLALIGGKIAKQN